MMCAFHEATEQEEEIRRVEERGVVRRGEQTVSSWQSTAFGCLLRLAISVYYNLNPDDVRVDIRQETFYQ